MLLYSEISNRENFHMKIYMIWCCHLVHKFQTTFAPSKMIDILIHINWNWQLSWFWQIWYHAAQIHHFHSFTQHCSSFQRNSDNLHNAAFMGGGGYSLVLPSGAQISDYICPKQNDRYINTHQLKPAAVMILTDLIPCCTNPPLSFTHATLLKFSEKFRQPA